MSSIQKQNTITMKYTCSGLKGVGGKMWASVLIICQPYFRVEDH